jgi:hypothetical protein
MDNEINDTTSKVGQATKSNGKWVAKESRDAAKSASGLTAQAGQMAQQAYEKVTDVASDLYDSVGGSSTKFVKAYPVQTAIGCLAVGFLIGAIAFRGARE